MGMALERDKRKFFKNHALTLMRRNAASIGLYYHDEKHVEEMLNFYRMTFIEEPSDELFLAILYHDAVYIPGFAHNEDASALVVKPAWRMCFGSKTPMPNDLFKKVYELISMTKISAYTGRPAECGSDAAKLQDADLHILGSSWKDFLRKQISVSMEHSEITPLSMIPIEHGRFLLDFAKSRTAMQGGIFVHRDGPLSIREERAQKNIEKFSECSKRGFAFSDAMDLFS